MSLFHLFTLVICLLIIAVNGRFEALRRIVGLWRFAVSIPLAGLCAYIDTPLLLPMTITILVLQLTTNYLKYPV